MGNGFLLSCLRHPGRCNHASAMAPKSHGPVAVSGLPGLGKRTRCERKSSLASHALMYLVVWSGLLFLAFVRTLAGAEPGTQGAQLPGTNQLWCGPSNAISVFASPRPQAASTLKMI